MADGYIVKASDINGSFLAYFIVNESNRAKAEKLVKAISLAESIDLVKELDASDLKIWRMALKCHPLTANFDLVEGTCVDLATWAHT